MGVLITNAMRGPTGEVAINDITMGLCGKDMRGFEWGFYAGGFVL